MDKRQVRQILTREFAKRLSEDGMQLPARTEDGRFPFLVAFVSDDLKSLAGAIKTLGGDVTVFAIEDTFLDEGDESLPSMIRFRLDSESGNVVQFPVRLNHEATVRDVLNYFKENAGVTSASFMLNHTMASTSEPKTVDYKLAA